MRFRKPLIVGLVALGLAFDAALVGDLLRSGKFGFDAYAYWSVDLGDLYGRSLGNLTALGAFRYSPAIAQVFSLFHLLPWWVFLWLWTALLVGTVVWLGGRWILLLLAFPPVVLELYGGNVNLLLAAAIVLGFRYPATWAFVLLTKVTPGIGLLWFAVRREWRNLALALGVTVAIIVVSFLAAPSLWGQWLAAISDNLRAPTGDKVLGTVPIPVYARLPFAAALIWWGARTDRRWVVPVAAAVATPVMWVVWSTWLAVLAGAVPLFRERTHATTRGRAPAPVAPTAETPPTFVAEAHSNG